MSWMELFFAELGNDGLKTKLPCFSYGEKEGKKRRNIEAGVPSGLRPGTTRLSVWLILRACVGERQKKSKAAKLRATGRWISDRCLLQGGWLSGCLWFRAIPLSRAKANNARRGQNRGARQPHGPAFQRSSCVCACVCVCGCLITLLLVQSD